MELASSSQLPAPSLTGPPSAASCQLSASASRLRVMRAEGWKLVAGRSLKVVPDPDAELDLPQPLAAGLAVLRSLIRVQVVFPILVEQRAPGPVEVDRESQRERLQPHAVGSPGILQTEPRDGARGAV